MSEPLNVPKHCPYCGARDLWPETSISLSHTTWRCLSLLAGKAHNVTAAAGCGAIFQIKLLVEGER